jgi:hypothetical protein
VPPFARPVHATLRCFLARQYPCTRLTSLELEGLSPYFWQTDCLLLTDFFRVPENVAEKTKGRRESRPSAIRS